MNQILLDLSLDHKKNNLFQFEMGILMIKLKSTYQKFFYLSELQKKKIIINILENIMEKIQFKLN